MFFLLILAPASIIMAPRVSSVSGPLMSRYMAKSRSMMPELRTARISGVLSIDLWSWSSASMKASAAARFLECVEEERFVGLL